MALHVYGVVRAGTRLPELPGVGDADEPVRPVEAGDLAAVVSEIASEDQLSDEDAVRHLDVLGAVVGQTSVLPLRFGTVAPDEDAVRAEVLEAAAPELRDRLDALDGLVELRVDLEFDVSDALRELLSARPQLRSWADRADGGDLDERIRLGELVAEGIVEWTRHQGDRVTAPLTELARRSARLATEDGHVDRWALLVARERLDELDDAVRALGDRLGNAEVRYVGPLPAYSFLDEPTTHAEQPTRWGW